MFGLGSEDKLLKGHEYIRDLSIYEALFLKQVLAIT